MSVDNCKCCVPTCTATEGLVLVRDHTCEATVCRFHYALVDQTWGWIAVKERLRGLGVKFNDEPMDTHYKDSDFCHDIGMQQPEWWEVWEAKQEKENKRRDLLKDGNRADRKL